MEQEKKYRIVLTNLPPTDESVQERTREELGDLVKVASWEVEREVNYRAKIPGMARGLFVDTPQRDYQITLRYKELKGGIRK